MTDLVNAPDLSEFHNWTRQQPDRDTLREAFMAGYEAHRAFVTNSEAWTHAHACFDDWQPRNGLF